MKNSIKDLKTLLVKSEQLTIDQALIIKGGCGTPKDPRRCKTL